MVVIIIKGMIWASTIIFRKDKKARLYLAVGCNNNIMVILIFHANTKLCTKLVISNI